MTEATTKTEAMTMALVLVDIASEAGAAIMEVFNRPSSHETKSDGSPLTEADLAADRIIHERLAEHFPDIPVLSEETSDNVDPVSLGDRFFVVDPLDGTKEFIKRGTDFTVNIALAVNGLPEVGVVCAPARSELWLAAKTAHYATLNPGAEISKASLEPIQCRSNPQTPLRAVASKSHRDDQIDAFLSQLGDCETVSVGSSLKFCLVADGRADIYPRFGPTMVWDTAAGQAVVEAAGGLVEPAFDGPLMVINTPNRGWKNSMFTVWGCCEARSKFGLQASFKGPS